MKKRLWILILVLVLSASLLSLSAIAETSGATGKKDGITLTAVPNPAQATEETSAGDNDVSYGSISFELTDECEYAGEFYLTLSGPEGTSLLFSSSGAEGGSLEQLSGDPDGYMFKLIPEAGKTLSFAIDAGPVPVPEETTVPPESKGCKSSIAQVIPVLIIIAVALVLLFKKDRKCTGRVLLILVLCFSFLPFASICSAAASTDPNIKRSFSVTVSLPVEQKETEITATLSYYYDFHESEGVKTTGMEQFEITYYWGPHGDQAVDESFYKAIAEAGFTSIPLENGSYENNLKALELMRKYGLTCTAVWDSRVYSLIANYSSAMTDDQIDAITKEVADSYKEYDDVIKGWWLADEPAVSKFAVLGRVKASFNRTAPGKTVMINLFPTYATNAQLGASSYEDYLAKYIDIVKPDYISYDHYHFRTSGNRAGFFTNIEAIRKAGLNAGLDQMSIILLTCHMGYSDVTPEQLAWEVNVSLAYGMKRISYFTFILDQGLLNDGWTDACMSYTDEIYPHYYEVQKISKWLKPLGDELFGKTSTAVFHIGTSSESGTKRYSSYGALGKVTGSGYLVGFFDDGSFLLVNKGYVAGLDERPLTLNDIPSGLEYFDTATSSWKAAETAPAGVKRGEDGLYVVTLDPGASMLFRVARDK